MEGKTLGNYRLGNRIGEGGMGSVYLARDLRLERDVALKIIAPELARSDSLMARFRVEAIAQARLNHSNIVTIHSFDCQDDIYYIVMEFVSGKTLKTVIQEVGLLPVPRAMRIFSRILEGLAYAHSKGVCHRDIKPANILITRDDNVKIGDFGIAKVEGIDGLTRVGSMLGTPHYCAPEQILGQRIGPAADIYSLGITLFEMITGKVPFNSASGSNYEIQQAHLQKMPQKPSTLVPSIDPALDDLIMKSLAKSPQARFQSVEEFKGIVDRFLSGNLRPSSSPPSRVRTISTKKFKLPPFKFPVPAFSSFKLKTGEIKRWLKLPSVPVNASAPTHFDKRKLLIILIPLLILLLIVVAISF